MRSGGPHPQYGYPPRGMHPGQRPAMHPGMPHPRNFTAGEVQIQTMPNFALAQQQAQLHAESQQGQGGK